MISLFDPVMYLGRREIRGDDICKSSWQRQDD